MEEITLQEDWEQVPSGECLYVHQHALHFLPVFVNDEKMAGRKTQLRPCEVQLKKKIELEEPTPLIARVVTQWNRARNKGLARLLKDLQ